MSYLKYPRLHFSGLFVAAPNTINNVPGNYSPEVTNVQLYWNPNGTGIFNLEDCVVTKVVYGPGDEAVSADQDPLIGQSIDAVYSEVPPKLVDLDPDQQGVSQIWGMNLQIAGRSAGNPHSIADSINGTFIATAFNAIWEKALNNPGGSTGLSAVYQGRLQDIIINDSANQSQFISQVAARQPSALSLNFTVSAHNNIPVLFNFDFKTFALMRAAGVPESVVIKLHPLTRMHQFSGRGTGVIPTESFVNHELQSLLEPSEYSSYKADILEASQQLYDPKMPHGFCYGEASGTLGLSDFNEPDYFVPSRMMAPYEGTGHAFFAPFDIDYIADASGAEIAYITVNLGNSLITDGPGSPAASGILGELSLVCWQPGASNPALDPTINSTTLGVIAYQGKPFQSQQAGFYVCKVMDDADIEAIKTRPLAILSKVNETTTALLAENKQGYFMRADQFVYRMNPSQATTNDQPNGNSANINVHVCKFGAAVNSGQDRQELSVQLSHSTALSTQPESALVIKQSEVKVENGIASFEITAYSPGNPRAYIDGQVFFLDYGFVNTSIAKDYVSDPNDIISILVFQSLLRNGCKKPDYIPTWNGNIADILSQYAKLYPIMSRFGLADYDSVKQNAEAIRSALTRPLQDPLHMPVTRDLSYDRLQLILKWMDNDMPLN